MNLWEIIVIAVALGTDVFSVAFGAGCVLTEARQKLRLSVSFGLFQFVMPLIGCFLGPRFIDVIRDYDHWIAFIFVFVIGAKMLYDSLRKGAHAPRGDVSRGWTLLILSVATSVDALAVGFAVGMMGAQLLPAALVIGIVAFLMTLGGLQLGRTCNVVVGKRAETLGAVVLIVIAFRLLRI